MYTTWTFSTIAISYLCKSVIIVSIHRMQYLSSMIIFPSVNSLRQLLKLMQTWLSFMGSVSDRYLSIHISVLSYMTWWLSMFVYYLKLTSLWQIVHESTVSIWLRNISSISDLFLLLCSIHLFSKGSIVNDSLFASNNYKLTSSPLSPSSSYMSVTGVIWLKSSCNFFKMNHVAFFTSKHGSWKCKSF